MDYKEYHPDWKDIIRPQILKRDQYKCRHCSIRHKTRVYKNARGKYVECDDFIEQWAENEGKKVFTLYLQVAHLDHNKKNNEPDNLLSLCPRCHGKMDREHKKFMRKVYSKKVDDSKISKKNLINPMIFLKTKLNNKYNIQLDDEDLEFIRTFVESILDFEFDKKKGGN